MPIAKVDGVEVEFEAGMNVLQVAELAGKEIPRFCYHERLSIAGNCRMCLVEVKPGPPKPQASCALPAAENMEIFTDTPMVRNLNGDNAVGDPSQWMLPEDIAYCVLFLLRQSPRMVVKDLTPWAVGYDRI